MSPKFTGIVEGLSSEEYHNNKGTYSSSQLKDLVEDPELFHKKYILKTQDKEQNSAFDVGTYFHTSILEPDKVQTECAVYDGVRRGKEWDAFQIEHKGKAIITRTEHSVAMGLVEAVKNSPVAVNRLDRGRPEVSAFVDVEVSCGEIFSSKGILGKYGWEDTKRKPLKDSVTIPLKVRADLLAETFILDLKSTTGNAKSEWAMRKKVSDYQYDLSAALYLDLFSVATNVTMSEFVWTFASKDYFNSRSYVASPENIQIGRAKYKKALVNLSDCISTNWHFEDYMAVMNPSPFEKEWLNTKGADLL